MSTAYSYF